MRVLIVGSSGFLGQTLVKKFKELGHEVIEAGRQNSPGVIPLDLATVDAKKLRSALSGKKFDYGVVCAGMTKLDDCARDPEVSRKVNVVGTKIVLQAIADAGAIPVFFSSDNVFPGTKPDYHEDSLRSPRSVYGSQKLEVEQWMQETFDKYLIFRTAKQISLEPNPKNPLTQIRNSLLKGETIRTVTDQWLNLVLTEDIATALNETFKAGLTGIYHLSTRKKLNHFQLAETVLKVMPEKPPGKIETIGIKDLKVIEPRMEWSTLDSTKIRAALPNVHFRELNEVLVNPKDVIEPKFHYKILNTEVVAAVDPVVLVCNEDVNYLKQVASRNPRQKMRMCSHRNSDDTLQEMVIVHKAGTYVRPHKHLKKAESLYVMEGNARFILYDDKGKITDVVEVGDYSSAKTFYYRISEPYYHSLLILSDFFVYHEVTSGPFTREETVFPTWAPGEGDTEAQMKYMSEMVRRTDDILAKKNGPVSVAR